jgi:tryptophan 2,3-dioxygenase
MDTYDPAADDLNWWFFELRRGVADALMPEAVRTPLYPAKNSRNRLSYYSYLLLDEILSAQKPTSRAPDERAFIVTHQLFELCFKLMIFDIGVIARTFGAVHQTADAHFRAEYAGEDPVTWRPARTAAARLIHSAETLIPSFLELLNGEVGPNQTFDRDEFNRFRQLLSPASGFQSVQARILQRALGKGGALAIRTFDKYNYAWHYDGVPDQHDLVTVDDPIVLREKSVVARPSASSPVGEAVQVEALACALLDRVAAVQDVSADDATSEISEQDVDRLCATFEGMVKARESSAAVAMTEKFREELAVVSAQENEKRTKQAKARGAYRALKRDMPESPILYCIDRLRLADDALFIRAEDPFLQLHRTTAVGAGLGPNDPGTAGGGMKFLLFSHELQRLFPLFAGF